MIPMDMFEQIHSMTELSHGKAGTIFSSVETNKPVYMLKNNNLFRVIITPEDYLVLEKAWEEEGKYKEGYES